MEEIDVSVQECWSREVTKTSVDLKVRLKMAQVLGEESIAQKI